MVVSCASLRDAYALLLRELLLALAVLPSLDLEEFAVLHAGVLREQTDRLDHRSDCDSSSNPPNREPLRQVTHANQQEDQPPEEGDRGQPVGGHGVPSPVGSGYPRAAGGGLWTFI